MASLFVGELGGDAGWVEGMRAVLLVARVADVGERPLDEL